MMRFSESEMRPWIDFLPMGCAGIAQEVWLTIIADSSAAANALLVFIGQFCVSHRLKLKAGSSSFICNFRTCWTLKSYGIIGFTVFTFCPWASGGTADVPLFTL